MLRCEEGTMEGKELGEGWKGNGDWARGLMEQYRETEGEMRRMSMVS